MTFEHYQLTRFLIIIIAKLELHNFALKRVPFNLIGKYRKFISKVKSCKTFEKIEKKKSYKLKIFHFKL